MTDWDNDNLPTDDDDDGLDWLDNDSLFDDSDSGGKEAGATGLTDELPWIGGNDEEDVVSDNDDEDLSWLTEDEPAAAVDSDIGAGLDWDSVDSDADDEDVSWLGDEDADDSPTEWQTPHPEVVDSEFEHQMDAAEAADFGDTDADLDWLATPESESSSDGGLDLPDWMADMELPDVSEDDLAAAHASVSDDDASDDDLDFDATSDDSGWGLEDDSADDSQDEEADVSFASLLGGSDDDDDDDMSFDSILAGSDDDEEDMTFDSILAGSDDDEEDVSFDSILAGSASDDDEDMSFDSILAGSASDDDDAIPTGDDEPTASDSMWGDLGSGFTQEMESVADLADDEPADTGWHIDDDSADAASDDDWSSDIKEDEEADQSEMDSAFDAMFANQDDEPDESWGEEAQVDEPDWMQHIEESKPEIEAVSETDDLLAELDTGGDSSGGELDDLLAELDTGGDADVDDLLAELDVVGDDDMDMDDLLAELEGVDDGAAGLDDLLADIGDTADEDYDADLNPLAFDEGISEIFESVNADELEFLADVESELEGGEDYDDAVDPLAFDTGITDLLEQASKSEMELLSDMEAELESDADFIESELEGDAVDPLAFDTGITDLFDTVDESELDFLVDVESQLEEPDDAKDPLFSTGITDLLDQASQSDMEDPLESDEATNLEDTITFDGEELESLASLDETGKLNPSTLQSYLDDLEPAASEVEEGFDFDFGDENIESVASEVEEGFDFDFGDEDIEPVASEVEEDFDFDFGDDDIEPVASEVEEDFGDDVEEELFSEPTPQKIDSGLLSRTDTDDLAEDLGFGDDTGWLDALDDAIEDEKEEYTPPEPIPTSVNVTDILDSLDNLEDIEEDDDFMPIKTDLDDIFDEYDMVDDFDDIVPDDVAEAAEIPEWLRDAASGKGDTYEASKVIRELEDRSLDDLDDRLLELHERGLELTSDATDSETDRQRLAKVVPNIGEALLPAKIITTETTSINTDPQLSPEQLQRAEILRSIVGEAVDSDGDEIAVRAAPRRRRLNLAIGRWLIAIVLAAAVLVPFYINDFHISDPPATTFNEDLSTNSGLWAYENINNLQPQEIVLFAVEYGATGARELDLFTEGLLTHILHQGAIPVIVSSDAIGSLRAENIVARLAGEDGYNREYYMAGYLPAGNLGLRDLAVNLTDIVSNNSNGQPTNLTMRSLDEFKTIILIADGGETIRDWMEQVVPQTRTPFIIAMSQSARPIAQTYVEAYVDDEGAGMPMLIGYADAVTYQSMLLSDYGLTVDAEATEATEPEATESPEPTATTPPTATDEPTSESTADVEAVPVIEETEEIESTATVEESTTTDEPVEVEPTPIVEPTEEPSPTDEPVEVEPTATIEATDVPSAATSEPSPTQETVDEGNLVEVATIIASGRVNVREGPGAGFDLVSTVAPGERLRVIGRNTENDWLQVVLSDGREAWVAAFLTEVDFISESEAESLYDWGKVRFFRPPPRNFQQSETETPTATPEPLVNVGRNASGTTIDVFDNADLDGTPIEDLPANSTFVVLEQTDTTSQILMVDGRKGWVETRFIRVDAVPLSDSGFVPTNTPTPTPSSTPTVTPTSTNTPTPTITPFTPDVFPEPITDVEARWNAMTLGLLATILLIFVGNAYWIIRWLRRRGE